MSHERTVISDKSNLREAVPGYIRVVHTETADMALASLFEGF